jgi:hypothetical protein
MDTRYMKRLDSKEFKGNSDEFRRRTHRRMLAELMVLVSAALSYFVKWPAVLPRWMVLGAVALAAGGLLIDLLHYRRGRALADSFVIQALPDSLSFSDLNGTRTIPYRDMAILTTQKRDGEIIEITLKVFPKISVKLRGLQDMNALCERLVDHLKS